MTPIMAETTLNDAKFREKLEQNNGVVSNVSVELDSKLEITSKVTLENVTITTSGFEGRVIDVLANGELTLNNVSITTSGANKHALNVYGENSKVVANGLEIKHQTEGAPLVISNTSSVELSGAINMTLGDKSWYAINLNAGGSLDLTGATLNVTTSDKNETQSVVCVDGDLSSVVNLKGTSGLSVVKTMVDGGDQKPQLAYVLADDLVEFVTAKTDANKDVEEVTLNSDIKVKEYFEIKEEMVVNGNGHSFIGTPELGKENVVTVGANGDNTVLNGVKIVTDAANKSGLHVYRAEGVVANDLTVDNTNTAGGAGIVANGCDLTLNGVTTITLGNNSWGAINVDDKNAVTSLAFGDDAKAVSNGVEGKDFIYMENVVGNKTIKNADKAGLVVGENGSYVVPHVHKLEHVEAVPATYESVGNIEYWYCPSCGKYFSDANATNEIAKEETVLAKLQEVDKTDLKALVDTVSKLDKNDYTKETYNALVITLDKANKVLANKAATEQEVKDAYANLDAAYKALKKVDQTKPEVEVPDTSVTYNYIIAGSLLAAGALAVTVVLKKRYSK